MDTDEQDDQALMEGEATEPQENTEPQVQVPTPSVVSSRAGSQASISGFTPVPSVQPRELFSQSQNTPRRSAGSVAASPFSATHWSSTPMTGTLPRGDMGHSTSYIHRPAAAPNQQRGPGLIHGSGLLPNTPGTPMSAVQSQRRPFQPGLHTQSQGVASEYGGADEAAGDDLDLQDPDNTFMLDADEDAALQQQLAETRIWGTDLNIQACMNIFRNFIEYFGIQGTEPSFYQQQLAYMHSTGDLLLNVNCAHLKSFPGTRNFYAQLRRYPHEVFPIMDGVVHELYTQRYGLPDGGRIIQVRAFGMEEQARMRALDPQDIDQLICIKGMVVRCSAVIPDLKRAFFRCFVCAHCVESTIDRGRIEEPKSCPQCQTLAAMEIIHNRCGFSDKQQIRLQETPDEIPAGETPHTVTVIAFDDLVDTVRPGDRIEVTGIFRALPKRTNPRLRTLKSIYKTEIDAVHFRRAEQGEDRLTAEEGGRATGVAVDRTVERTAENNNSNSSEGGANDSATAKQFSPARIAEFYAFAATGNPYERLVKSFAPSIWEMEDVKRGLLCLLFGGTIRKGTKKQREAARRRALGGLSSSSRESKSAFDLLGDEGSDNEDEEGEREDQQGGVHQRGDINVLLCGDPGTSKSQLLSYVHKLTPRGIYTSGKGSSAVGLTASVVRDPDSRDMVLESGALVLSDNGICCIDEFDKMTDQTRAILHEAMEQQTVSITKAGIIATLNARTSILASANPVQSRYNAKLSVVENIKLPPTLLSRFDLIYLILDKPNQESDRKLARHLVALYYDDEDEDEAQGQTGAGSNNTELQAVDQKFLRDYILYARTNVCPEISDAAEEVLVRNYVEMRSMGSRSLKTIAATPRQLESLIRLSQALAKMRLSETVTAEDVLEATRLMKVATQTAATDPRTGTIDMDLITTGQTALGRELTHQLADAVRVFLCEEYQRGRTNIHLHQVYQELRRNVSGNAQGGGANMGELDLTVERVAAAVDALAEEKLLFVARSKAITIHESITHTF